MTWRAFADSVIFVMYVYLHNLCCVCMQVSVHVCVWTTKPIAIRILQCVSVCVRVCV